MTFFLLSSGASQVLCTVCKWRMIWRIKHFLPSGPYLKVALPHFSFFSLHGPQLCRLWQLFFKGMFLILENVARQKGRISALSFIGAFKNRIIYMVWFRNHFRTTSQVLSSFCDRILLELFKSIATSMKVVSKTTFEREIHRTGEMLSS